jgi:hypothetical protein
MLAKLTVGFLSVLPETGKTLISLYDTEKIMKPANRKEWFRMYSIAMLEMDGSRLFDRIEAAQNAIRTRLAELSGSDDAPEKDREQQDIRYALGHLRRLQVYGAVA